MDFLWDEFQTFLQRAVEQSRRLPAARQELLSNAARDISAFACDAAPANLLFVCTHNSRRSQFSQFWAAVAAHRRGANHLRCFSCGTEATACNPRTVDSLRRAGVRVTQQAGEADNPVYHCTFDEPDQTQAKEKAISIDLFSKAFGHPSLPTENIAAMMCCDDADARCPHVAGAKVRVPLHYRDPKHSDGSPQEAAIYDERSLQIAAEMLFLVEQVQSAG